jgi:acetylornithine deacetylase/succinyl-diaminopimelate desuccinylase-like protein
MTDTDQNASGREQRVRDWIRALTELPDRFAGTPIERAAAERIGGWMRALNARDVTLEPAPSAPRAGFVLALHTGLALLGVWIGGFAGVVLTGVVAWSFRSDLRHRRPRLARLLPVSESVNVCGRIGATAPTRRVVLSAHIDTAQAGVLFAPSLADRFATLAPDCDGATPLRPARWHSPRSWSSRHSCWR